MKKTYITVDVETIVSGVSKSENYLAAVYLGAMFIANELKQRNLKATFFISLSSKQKNINNEEYLGLVRCLVMSLKEFDNIRIAPHLHAYNLPVDFDCPSDDFGAYTEQQQINMLKFSKSFFSELGCEVDAFRPGGFRRNEFYYKALKEAGFKYSSTMLKEERPNINLETNETKSSKVFNASYGIQEYPVTTVELMSIKRKVETINLSPDFLTINSVKEHLENLDYININFHSFSIYLNRLVRENHNGIVWNNIRFLAVEKILDVIANLFGVQTFHKNTIVKNAFIDWLNFLDGNQYETYFIGE